MKCLYTDERGVKKLLGEVNSLQEAIDVFDKDARTKFVYSIGTPVVVQEEGKVLYNFTKKDGSLNGYSLEADIKHTAIETPGCNIKNTGF